MFIVAKRRKQGKEDDEGGSGYPTAAMTYVALEEEDEGCEIPHVGVRETQVGVRTPYKAIPCLSEQMTTVVAWMIIVVCGVGNVFVVVLQLTR